MPIASIDIERSLQNQARMFNRLDSERVDTYAEALERGDQFPAVVLHRTLKRKVHRSRCQPITACCGSVWSSSEFRSGRRQADRNVVDQQHDEVAGDRAGLTPLPSS